MSVSESVLAAMRRTNEQFDAEVVKKQNMQALDQIYTSEARVLPPGGPMVMGREKIKTFWQQTASALGVTAAKLNTIHAEEAGDGVVEVGNAELTVTGGQVAVVKYVVHWKQEDGNWKWNIDIWNTSQ